MTDALQQIQLQIQEYDKKISESQSLLSDPDFAPMAEEEIKQLTQQKKALEESAAMLQTDYSKSEKPDSFNMDNNNVIFEIRGGAGGEEAKLFAEDLMQMYLRFAQLKGFKVELIDEGAVKIKGKLAYKHFKYESGVHRVQRVPVTESSGRIHTSTASVAVLPEVTPTQIEVREEDLEWKFTRAGGHGGQNVNKVNTAVMLTHRPSGIVVHCRQERRQQQNRMLALDMLRSQLWEIAEEERLKAIKKKRSLAIGRAMRAEKIKTYNFPENRLTDHRIPQTWYNLDRILTGNGLEEILITVASHLDKIEEQIEAEEGL
jgi:peptide chain release factor 1